LNGRISSLTGEHEDFQKAINEGRQHEINCRHQIRQYGFALYGDCYRCFLEAGKVLFTAPFCYHHIYPDMRPEFVDAMNAVS